MEQTNNNSIEVQISKIIFNTLIQNQVIYLPGVGSLQVERVASEIKRWGQLLPPRHIVKYSAEVEGVSVIDIIVRESGCSQEVAKGIYDKWYNTSKCDGGVEIIGVGKVVNQRFNISSYLDNILNNELHKAIQLKRRKASRVWIGVSVIGCVLVGLVANMLFDTVNTTKEPTPQVVEVVQEPIQEVVEKVQVAEVVSSPPQPNVPIVANPRYRVVYGVFSVMENALRAEKIVYSKLSSGITTEIRPYGKMFMVSIFASDNISECQSFVNKNKDVIPDMWIYKRRN